MKQILFFLLLSFSAQAQIDLSKLTAPDDSTIVALDTSYWAFHTAEIQRGEKTLPLFQADFVVWRGGHQQINLSSGPKLRREYAEYLRTQRDRLNNELNVELKAVISLRAQRDAIIAELLSLRD